MTNGEEKVQTLLTMINLMPDDDKRFIRDNIILKNEALPEAYIKTIRKRSPEFTAARREYAKEYGWTWVTNGKNNKKIVLEIEPVPKGYGIGETKLNSSLNKRVKCIETGIIYDSLTAASADTGLYISAISNVANGKQASSMGTHWEFVE